MMNEPGLEFGEAVAGATYLLRSGGYAVIRNTGGEVAVVATRQGLFLPGGRQEDSETSERAAVREADEERGLRIRLLSRLDTADELVFEPDEATYFRKRCAFFNAGAARGRRRSRSRTILD